MRDAIVKALMNLTPAHFGAASDVRPVDRRATRAASRGLIAPGAHDALLQALANRPQAPRRAA